MFEAANLKTNKVQYSIATASEGQIFDHLKKCSRYFDPPLDERVNLAEYSKKLFDKSIVFEAWSNNVLIGFIGAYIDEVNKTAFISNVSLLRLFMGKGIASKLLQQCIDYMIRMSIKEISLEVNSANHRAIRLYEKFHFVRFAVKGESLLMKVDTIKATSNG